MWIWGEKMSKQNELQEKRGLKQLKYALTFIFLALLLILASCTIENPIIQERNYTTPADKMTAESPKICSFNAQIFGESKVNDELFMDMLKSKIKQCDLFFLLEIRDKSEKRLRHYANK